MRMNLPLESNRNGVNGKRNGYMKLSICPATGGQIEVNVPEKENGAGLKWNLLRKFRISTEKMTLLFKDRPLKEGSLLENQVTEFSRIFLFPNMESGMRFHGTDVGVIQALENLSECQGVYSGTFSGTLDPSLQDLDGKPKRNISTIIHILNELLGATPQYQVESPTTPHNDRNLLEHNMENKGGNAGFPGNQSEEDNALRGKVKDLQMKMEDGHGGKRRNLVTALATAAVR
ncbi:Hypothetical predicted protein [Octopus vulgaris]|uniref:Uncharacterized protein n=1 Tax=Octopus vulgaris TaxID=6645 RepID=A0AA36FM35_OCTVU|nr:Hypothetical predicted protein [Octopus vulgaris]